MATLLSICQDVCDRVNLARPTQITSGTTQTTRTLRGCAQREGVALARRWSWQALLREHTFVSVAAVAQTNSIPTDWDGRILSDTFWNRSMTRPVQGPLDSREWQAVKSGGVSAVTDAFRFRASLIELTPTPAAGVNYAYEYITSQWCESAAGVGQTAWAADTDVPRLDTELMTLGVMWRFLQGRGLEFSVALADYEAEVMKAMARDGSRRVISLSGEGRAGPRTPATPEGSWNL
jgi:hypothetical protein